MKKGNYIFTILLLTLKISSALSQEWRDLNAYQKESGKDVLAEGCWLKKDRIRQTQVWCAANMYNLNQDKGYLKYRTITEINAFYSWFEGQRKKKGHEVKWIGITCVVTSQLSKLDNSFIRNVIVRDKEVCRFANEASLKVFEYSFPVLRELCFTNEPISGEDAVNWDIAYGMKEQCEILEPLYHTLSPKTIKRLDKMAKGKGIFSLGVPKDLKFEGNIEDCKTRFEHGMYTVNRYLTGTNY